MDRIEDALAAEFQGLRTTGLLTPSIPADATHVVDPEGPVFSIGDLALCHRGELLCICGESGAGKSQFVSALISGCIAAEQLAPEVTLGITVRGNSHRKAVLHLDTLQTDTVRFENFCRILRRAGYPPYQELDYFYSQSLLDIPSPAARLQEIAEQMDVAHVYHGGLHVVVIDEILDLVESVNDKEECAAVVRELCDLAKIYKTCMVCTTFWRADELELTGHLWQELLRTSSSILELSVEVGSNGGGRHCVQVLKVSEATAAIRAEN